ncbi:MAG: DUF4328 domain-containing protein, partial [Alphaproteobacteria bacterium]
MADMGQYIDPAGRAKVARIALIVYVIAELTRMGVLLVSPADSTVVRTATLIVLVTMLGAMVATGYWIYRVNANAHSFADGLTITPGWNVGWFFVPIANLWKPFEGIKEVWQAGVDPAEWPRVE